MNHILVVDDELAMRTALQASFARHGWPVESAGGLQEAMAKFQRSRHSLVVTDVRMPDGDGLAVMREVRAVEPRTGVILLTAYGSIPDAVRAMKNGACDYLVKPVVFEELERAARRILERSQQPDADGPEPLIGHSAAWLQALQRARQIASSDADVLIQAESGTGKELVARMVHRLSRRAGRPLIAVNCAAFPEALLESELFGHARGAFTGAVNAKPGKFELAQGGTLLLDEIGEMPLPLQPKLLRALQEREFDRLGDTRTLKVDIRVIATTNRSLEQMVKAGSFRADLYYRLNVIPLTLPPLRERVEDIPELALHFARRYTTAGTDPELSPEFLRRLQRYSWPGNVRELANLMHRAAALGDAALAIDALPGEMEEPGPAAVCAGMSPGLSLGEMEKRLLEMTLAATHGNRSRAAEMLGISLRTVRNKIREYGLPSRQSYVHD
ncbi:MAG TPA: sigma-54 dependent transcriptional regulator [Terriglobales bacterium]|nr:sigma-54 dependent transcriptional regulator [Terriglobales bacterium]